jgi:glycosyltransferase involved in cell wall biosynthesis
MRKKIAYIMSRFPHLPETFILREMIAMEAQGWDIELYPLIVQQQSVVHAEAQAWLARAHHFPWLSADILTANLRQLTAHPLRYVSLWSRLVWENRTSLKFMLRAVALFPKAVRMAEQMRREGVSHVHAHYATHPALVAWLIHKLTGIQYSVTVHAHDIFAETAMLATKLREATFIIAISNYNREYLAKEMGAWIKDKIHVVHCGINPGMYKPRNLLPASNESFEIISVGSLQPYKGMRYLTEACALLRERGLPIHCRIIGDGEERPILQQMISDRKLVSCVELMGSKTQAEVAQLLPSAHCYVQPGVVAPSGKMEGIPVSIMEAFASGLAVVATELSGVPELVRPGVTGYLVPPADAMALADALSAVYMNPGEATRMAKAGRELVLQEFWIDNSARQLSVLLERSFIAPGVFQFAQG